MRLLLLALVAGTFAGCSTLDPLYRDAPYGDVRADRVPERAASDRLRRDVDRYVRDVDRAVHLDRRQVSRIADRLERRARQSLRHDRGRRDRDVYPFPRSRRTDRAADRFWDAADRDVLDELSRHQRDDYRRFTRQFEPDRGRYDDGRRESRRDGRRSRRDG